MDKYLLALNEIMKLDELTDGAEPIKKELQDIRDYFVILSSYIDEEFNQSNLSEDCKYAIEKCAHYIFRLARYYPMEGAMADVRNPASFAKLPIETLKKEIVGSYWGKVSTEISHYLNTTKRFLLLNFPEFTEDNMRAREMLKKIAGIFNVLLKGYRRD